MKREEAILNAAEIANILEKRGMNGAANSLRESLKVLCTPRNPWVKTSDRLPTEADAPRGVVLISGYHNWYSVQAPKTLELYPQYYPWWMPIPPLPEEVK